VDPDGLTALADELAALAAALTQDVDQARSAAAAFPEAFGGLEGFSAGATATAWACLYDVLACRTSSLAGALRAAAAAYLAADAELAGSLGWRRGPR
jgi:hypothetical protein